MPDLTEAQRNSTLMQHRIYGKDEVGKSLYRKGDVANLHESWVMFDAGVWHYDWKGWYILCTLHIQEDGTFVVVTGEYPHSWYRGTCWRRIRKVKEEYLPTLPVLPLPEGWERTINTRGKNT